MVSANGHLVPEAIVCPPVRTHAPERANRARTRRSLASWQPVDTCGGGGRVYTVSRSIVPSLHDSYVDGCGLRASHITTTSPAPVSHVLFSIDK